MSDDLVPVPGCASAARRRPPRWPWVLVLLLSVAIGAGVPAWSQGRVAARFAVRADDVAVARTELALLTPVDALPAADGYEREAFGQAWADVDGNGCDTRNDVLARDLTDAATDPASAGCTVLAGTLADPYTGEVVPFARGPDSADVQVDHVVALADAWASGASAWTAQERERFANDPANLLAVDGATNGDKGASDAATWLPPNVGYRCVYALRQVRVKAAYGLAVAADERAALARALAGCVVVP